MSRTSLLFVCDTLLSGEADHALLADAIARGVARTTTHYALADLGATGALLDGGLLAIVGELYEVTPAQLAAIDVKRGHPLLHQRRLVLLDGGLEADGYFISMDQARGVRRLRGGDWKGRFAASRGVTPSPLVTWAKRRFDR